MQFDIMDRERLIWEFAHTNFYLSNNDGSYSKLVNIYLEGSEPAGQPGLLCSDETGSEWKSF